MSYSEINCSVLTFWNCTVNWSELLLVAWLVAECPSNMLELRSQGLQVVGCLLNVPETPQRLKTSWQSMSHVRNGWMLVTKKPIQHASSMKMKCVCRLKTVLTFMYKTDECWLHTHKKKKKIEHYHPWRWNATSTYALKKKKKKKKKVAYR